MDVDSPFSVTAAPHAMQQGSSSHGISSPDCSLAVRRSVVMGQRGQISGRCSVSRWGGNKRFTHKRSVPISLLKQKTFEGRFQTKFSDWIALPPLAFTGRTSVFQFIVKLSNSNADPSETPSRGKCKYDVETSWWWLTPGPISVQAIKSAY